ncbi:MAG TPA: methyltransferase domain-containing protein [Phycisphaerae bacterium]|nr:methyltransferase domain-containing protein [Phycisphaerae bacterium]
MQRFRCPELMDDPSVDAGEHRRALDALRRTNRRLGIDRRLVSAIEASLNPGTATTILEIGPGGGGWLAAARDEWRLIALDRSDFALREARDFVTVARSNSANPPSCLCSDALALPLADRSVDVTVCSLLLHHFDPPQAVRLLHEAGRVTRRLLIIADLNRGYLAWALTWLVTRLTSTSPVFRVDGPRSVRAAYRPAEASELAAAAGLCGADIRRMFPFRWVLKWRRDGQA